jgi:Sap, sulfolipid-1-addressing protein
LSFEPIRIGSTVMVLNRPRPMLQLLAFSCGGYVMGMGVGLIVLFIRWRTPSTTTNITVPRVEMVIGLLAPRRREDSTTSSRLAVVAASTWTHHLLRGRAAVYDGYLSYNRTSDIRLSACNRPLPDRKGRKCGGQSWNSGTGATTH